MRIPRKMKSAAITSLTALAFGALVFTASAEDRKTFEEIETEEETCGYVEAEHPKDLEELKNVEVVESESPFTLEEEEMLLRTAMAEAESEGIEGKALVMMTIINRVNSEFFPDSIEEVIFQENQFSTAVEGGRYYTSEPDDECYSALELIESGWDESQGSLYFESCAGESWQSRNLELLYQYKNHRFYR